MSSQATVTVSTAVPQYRLRSDLALYCLPSANRDDTRYLAWANSICLLFVTIAAMNLRQPVFVIREAAPPPEPLPVVILPPPPEQPNQPQETPTEPAEETVEESLELPVITPVQVAAPDQVNFGVAIEGYVALAPNARYVPPPPAIIPKAPPPADNLPKPDFRVIRLGDRSFTKMPPPSYPQAFLRDHISGTVEVLITVNASGVPTSVEVAKSSGFPALDRHTCDSVKRDWRAEPGEDGRKFRCPLIYSAK